MKYLLLISRVFLYLFVVFSIFQVKFLIFTPTFFKSGFFNQYHSFFLHFSYVFLFLSVFFLSIFFIFFKPKFDRSIFKKNINLLVVIACFLFFQLFSLFFSVDLQVSLFMIFQTFVTFIFFLILISGFIPLRSIILVFLITMFFASLIGLLQFFLQSSLGLYVIGEPLLSIDQKSVSYFVFNGAKILRSYSVFPHPNVFAGFLVFSIILCNYFFKKPKFKFLKATLLIFFLVSLLFTFSRSGFLALLVYFFYYFMKSFKISLKSIFIFVLLIMSTGVLLFIVMPSFIERFFDISSDSFADRIMLLRISKNIFFDNFFGVGIGNFTNIMQNYFDFKLFPWLLQPVHNIFVLSFVETGIFGGLALLFLMIYLFFSLFSKKHGFKNLIALFGFTVSIIIIGNLDHYFSTIFQGKFLFWYMISFHFRLSE